MAEEGWGAQNLVSKKMGQMKAERVAQSQQTESWCLVSNALMGRELIHDLPYNTVLRTVKYVCVYSCMLRTYAQVKNSSLMYMHPYC